MANRRGKAGSSDRFPFLGGSKMTVVGDCSHEIKMTAFWQESYDKPRQCVKKQSNHFANKGPYSQGFPTWC